MQLLILQQLYDIIYLNIENIILDPVIYDIIINNDLFAEYYETDINITYSKVFTALIAQYFYLL